MSDRSWDKSQNRVWASPWCDVARHSDCGRGAFGAPPKFGRPSAIPGPGARGRREETEKKGLDVHSHARLCAAEPLNAPASALNTTSRKLMAWTQARGGGVSSPDRHLCPESQKRVKAHETERALPRRGPARGPPPSAPAVRRLLRPSVFAVDKASLGGGCCERQPQPSAWGDPGSVISQQHTPRRVCGKGKIKPRLTGLAPAQVFFFSLLILLLCAGRGKQLMKLS